MVFSSLNFLFVFLPLCIVLYYISSDIRIKNTILLLLSLVFYTLGDPKGVILLLVCILVNYIFGRIIDGCYQTETRTLFTAAAIIFQVSVLMYYKLFDAMSGRSSITIPLGVSFFTFQCIAYIVDVHRRTIRAQKNIFHFALFITLFPQLIAGPILRYSDVDQQIKSREHSWESMSEGIVRFIIGLSKKVLIADVAGGLVSNTLGSSMTLSVQAWFGLLMFGFQIYFDFSGYSDMAVGLGKMFGFQYPENFKYPYTATSLAQFWRRWHITLSTFFRDYIYIPLGGNRRRYLFNLFVVWMVTAFWHGMGSGFLIWGLYYFVLISAEKKFKIKLPPALGRITTFLIVYFAWSFFYFETLEGWLGFARVAFHMNAGELASPLGTTLLINNLPFTLLCFVASTPVCSQLSNRLPEKWKQPLMMIGSFCLLVICTAFIFAQDYVPFIYYKF